MQKAYFGGLFCCVIKKSLTSSHRQNREINPHKLRCAACKRNTESALVSTVFREDRESEEERG